MEEKRIRRVRGWGWVGDRGRGDGDGSFIIIEFSPNE